MIIFTGVQFTRLLSICYTNILKAIVYWHKKEAYIFRDHYILILNTVSKHHDLFCGAAAAEGMIIFSNQMRTHDLYIKGKRIIKIQFWYSRRPYWDCWRTNSFIYLFKEQIIFFTSLCEFLS